MGIMNWRDSLEFPPEVPISRAARKTIKRFCDAASSRISGVSDVKKLPWFNTVDWEHIRDRPAAFPVNVTAIDDTKNFDEFPEVELNFKTEQGRRRGWIQRLDVHELHFQKVRGSESPNNEAFR